MAVNAPEIRKLDDLDGKTFLICVGAAKCATSWIYHALDTSPEIAVSPLKEVHFFSAKFPANALGNMNTAALKRLAFHIDQKGDVLDNLLLRDTFQASVDRVQMIYDDNAYFDHFARLCTRSTKAICDITPGYSVIGKAGFSYMSEFCATQDIRLKILFVMRDPVERLWSQLRHMQQTNPANNALEKWPKALEAPRIYARSDYRRTVSDLDDVFLSEDILYLFYEDLFSTTALARICDHAGIGTFAADAGNKRNETTVKLTLPDDARSAMRDLLEPQYAFCRDRFGAAVPESWGN